MIANFSTNLKRRRLGLFMAVAVVALGITAVALAVHDLDIFELEGNAVIDGSGDDWIRATSVDVVDGEEVITIAGVAAPTTFDFLELEAPSHFEGRSLL